MGDVDIPKECQWCEKQEKLLIKWAEKAAGYRWLHNHARLYFKRQNDYLSYPSIVIASITGVGGFAVLNPSGGDNVSDEAHTRIIVIQYFFAFLNVMGGILTSISKFSQSSTLIETHSNMCVQWSKFYRNIDMEISLDAKHRVDVVEFVTKSREEYDRLLSEAPDIPEISIKAFNELFPDKETKPDVCNGLSIIVSDDQSSIPSTTKTISRWISGMSRAKTSRKSLDVAQV